MQLERTMRGSFAWGSSPALLSSEMVASLQQDCLSPQPGSEGSGLCIWRWCRRDTAVWAHRYLGTAPTRFAASPQGKYRIGSCHQGYCSSIHISQGAEISWQCAQCPPLCCITQVNGNYASSSFPEQFASIVCYWELPHVQCGKAVCDRGCRTPCSPFALSSPILTGSLALTSLQGYLSAPLHLAKGI